MKCEKCGREADYAVIAELSWYVMRDGHTLLIEGGFASEEEARAVLGLLWMLRQGFQGGGRMSAYELQPDGTLKEIDLKRADLVAVVRCRDCKRFSLDNSDHDYRSGWWCHRWNTDMVKPDGFCAWGEGGTNVRGFSSRII